MEMEYRYATFEGLQIKDLRVPGDRIELPTRGFSVFRYSISAGRGDWRAKRAYRAGIGLNNPLIPVSVVDRLSSKMLPPSRSFCYVEAGNLVISAIKKSDLDSAVLLRVYDIEGSATQARVDFLNQQPDFREEYLLEEDAGPPGQRLLKLGPYGIKTVKTQVSK